MTIDLRELGILSTLPYISLEFSRLMLRVMVSVMGRRTSNSATGLDAESRSFGSSQDIVPFSWLRSGLGHI